MRRFRQTLSSNKESDTGSNIERLVTSLTNSRIATENNALYQTIFGLIKQVGKGFTESGRAIATIKDAIDGSGGASGSGGTPGILSQTFLTATNQTATLANSRELIAGSGILFDDSVAGQRIISSIDGVAGYWTLLTDGDVDETDLIFADGDAISVFITV